VAFSSKGTIDYDGDDISFEWSFGEAGATSNEENPSYTYGNPGTYQASLKVTDSEGNSSTEMIDLQVGNDPPEIKFSFSGNSSFFFDGQEINYQVSITDTEDGSTADGTIGESDVSVTYAYNADGRMKQVKQMGHQTGGAGSQGLALIQGSDCKACHDEVTRSIGPSYNEVALKYKDDSKANEYLVEKVISGGGGVWGDQAMAAHPQLIKEDAILMIKYIRSLADKNILPIAGSIETSGESGFYVLTAEYTDKGSDEVKPITSKKIIYLRSTTVPTVDVDHYEKTRELSVGEFETMRVRNGTILVLENIDLTGISSIDFQGSVEEGSIATLEVRSESADGEVLTAVDYVSSGTHTGYGNSYFVDVSASLTLSDAVHDLYFVLTSDTQTNFGTMSKIVFQ